MHDNQVTPDHATTANNLVRNASGTTTRDALVDKLCRIHPELSRSTADKLIKDASHAVLTRVSRAAAISERALGVNRLEKIYTELESRLPETSTIEDPAEELKTLLSILKAMQGAVLDQAKLGGWMAPSQSQTVPTGIDAAAELELALADYVEAIGEDRAKELRAEVEAQVANEVDDD